MRLVSRLSVALLAAVAGTCPAAVGTALRYSVTDLGALSGPKIEAIAINDRGEVVGNADTLAKDSFGAYVPHAFLWRNGKIRDLGTLGYRDSRAFGINNRGQIVGLSTPRLRRGKVADETHAFLWENGHVHDLGLCGESVAINNRGQATGDGPFLWRKGHMRYLGPIPLPNQQRSVFYPPGTGPHHWDFSRGTSINDTGEFVGISNFSGDEYGFSWRRGVVRGLQGLDGGSVDVDCLNDQGQVAGDVAGKAMVWKQGRIYFLGSLGHDGSEALSLNNRGQIVGYAYNVSDSEMNDGYVHERALLWRSGEAHDLSKLIPPGSGWTLQEAHGINNHGQIVGSGVHNGKNRAFLLTPVAH